MGLEMSMFLRRILAQASNLIMETFKLSYNQDLLRLLGWLCSRQSLHSFSLPILAWVEGISVLRKRVAG